MSSSTTKTTFDNAHISRQTGDILNTHSLHFISISLLFLPLTFLACIIIQFYVSSSSFSPDSDVNTFFEPFNFHIIRAIVANSHNLLTVKSLTTILAIIIFVVFPTVAGIALITYSTNQSIHNKRPTFSSAFNLPLRSYIHLLSTILAGLIKLIIISILFTLSPIAITHAIRALGFHFDLSLISLSIKILASYGLLITIVFYIVTWGSAATIAVLESKLGFEPLTQSANQLTEYRSHSFFIVFFTGFMIGPALSYSVNVYNIESTANWTLILQECAIYLQSSMMISYYVVANTVLYVECKVACGEEPQKTTVGGDVSGEYVKVVVNEKDDDVSNELAKGDTNGGFNYIMCLSCIVWVVLSFISMMFKNV